MDMHEPITTSIVVSHGALALFGGVVHALNAQREGKSKGMVDLSILAFISTFSGVMFALTASYLFPHEMYLSHAAAGAGGFLGVEGLSALAAYITQRITGKK